MISYFRHGTISLIHIALLVFSNLFFLLGILEFSCILNFKHQVLLDFGFHRLFLSQLFITESAPLFMMILLMFRVGVFVERLYGRRKFIRFVGFIFFTSPLLLMGLGLVLSVDLFRGCVGPVSLVFALLSMSYDLMPTREYKLTNLFLAGFTVVGHNSFFIVIHAMLGVALGKLYRSEYLPFSRK